MVKHVVMWRLHQNNAENRSVIKDLLNNLPAVIPELKSLEAGEDISRGPVAFDLVLITTHADTGDLEKYQKHPEHVSVAKRITELASDRVVVDFEY
jgi:hypothetical protein